MKAHLFCGFLFLSLFVLSGCNSDSGTTSNAHPAATAATPHNALPKDLVENLLQKLATQDGCKDSTADMRLTFTDADGKAQQIDFRLQRKYEAGKVSTLMTVLAPPDESEKALLAFEEDGKPTLAISYLAGLKKVVQLKSDNPLNFRGAKSTVQEMLGMEFGQYTIANLTAPTGPTIVELKAKGGSNLNFPRIDLTFSDDKTPLQLELYDGRNEKVKTIHIRDVVRQQKYLALRKMEIEDHRNKMKLQLETRNIKYDSNLAASLFTEAHLIKTVTAASQKQIQ